MWPQTRVRTISHAARQPENATAEPTLKCLLGCAASIVSSFCAAFGSNYAARRLSFSQGVHGQLADRSGSFQVAALEYQMSTKKLVGTGGVGPAGAGQSLQRLAPVALERGHQRLLDAGAGLRDLSARDRHRLRIERRLFHATFATDDQKEGMSAFAEKRPPVFKNR